MEWLDRRSGPGYFRLLQRHSRIDKSDSQSLKSIRIGRHSQSFETSILQTCQTTMRFILTTAIILSFCQAGCGSSPSVNPDAVQTWPQSVADTCPQRKVLLECFRREGIRVGMRTLSPHFHRCIRSGMATVKVMLSIETKGGTPTCVARSPHSNKAALCLARS